MGLWLLNCDAMIDVVLLQTVYNVLRKAVGWRVWFSFKKNKYTQRNEINNIMYSEHSTYNIW